MKNLTIEDITTILKDIYKIAQAQEGCETCPFNDTCICENYVPCREWEDNI